MKLFPILSIPFLLTATICAQQPAREPAPAPAPAPAKEAPAEWPKLDRQATARTEQVVQNLTANKEELRLAAQQELLQIGAGAVPALLRKLSDREVERNAPYLAMLNQLATAEHAGAIARSLRDQRASARIWALRRFIAFHDRAHVPIVEQALKDRDAEVQFQASLALVASGELSALPAVITRARDDWQNSGSEILAAIAPARGEPAARELINTLDQHEFNGALARIRLLRALGTKESMSALKGLLDSNDHAIKRETINTLRVVVDGQPVLETLSVFQAIEQAKEWKTRI